MTTTARATHSDLAALNPHGELDCADAEAMLADQARTNYEQRVRIEALTAEMEMMRLEQDRLLALHEELAKKSMVVASERDGLEQQVKFLGEELLSVQNLALPDDTVAFGSVDRDFLVTTYRGASRITRGPVPPVVTEAVESAKADIEAAMIEVGRKMMEDIIKREVRRRRRSQNSTGNRTRR